MKIGVQLAGTIGLLWAIAPAAQAQVPISGLGTSYQTGTTRTVTTTGASPSNGGYTSNAAFTLNFGSTTANDRTIQTFDTGTGAGLRRYNFGGLVSNIYVRRNEANFPGTNRQLGFFERSSLTNIISSYAPDMEAILRSQTINRGTDNTFANQGNASGNNSNIERLDFVSPAGLAAPSDPTQINDIGFLILERGGNDSVKIAAITSIDATGTPTGYGPVVTQISSQWGLSGLSLDYSVMRKDAIDTDWRPSDSGNQRITGIYFSFGSLGVTAGQTIYGYSIIPADVTATSGPNLINWLNYPTNTSDVGTTGIDLMAGGGVFLTHTIKGTVFSDPNGSQVQDLPGEAGVSGGLRAVLLSPTGVVLQVQTVAANGTYAFTGVATPIAGSPYTVLVTTTAPTVGSSTVNITLPAGYVSTGENKKNTIDPVIDTRVSVSVTDFINLASQPLLTEAIGINFGIEQLPKAVTTTTPSQANPNRTTSVAVPVTLFNTSTDPDGTVNNYRITAFPTNATSIEIDGIVYTATVQSGTIAFPAGGVTILATNLNTIKVDPVDGIVNVTIPFKAIDNAGKESANTVNAIVPFTAASTPELILLKRITKINGTNVGKALNGTTIDLTQVVAQPDNPATLRNESSDATNANWPIATYPKGAIDAGVIKSGDTIEYTIYFLSGGQAPVTNANFCDWVPKNTTFVPDSYGLGRGIQLAIGLILTTFTNVPDGDRGVFYNPGAIPPATYPNANTFKLNCMSPAGTDGAVVVNIVNNTLASPNNQLPNATTAGTPDNSYGFVRFVSKVK